MFKISNVKTRYFSFEAPDSKQPLLLEPPKLKTLRAIQNLQADETSSIDAVAGCVAAILSKSKGRRKISAEQVMDWMDTDQMMAFLTEFLSWVTREKKTDPN